MEGGPLSDDRIIEFNETVVPFLHVTTKLEDKQHDGLLAEFGYNMFPTVAFMNADAEVVTLLSGYDRSIEGFIKTRDDAIALVELIAAAKSDPGAAKRLLLLRIDRRLLRFEEAVAAAAELELSTEESEAFETKLAETLSRMPLAKARAAAATIEWRPTAKLRVDAILLDLEIDQALRPLTVMLPAVKPGEKQPERPWHICWSLYGKGKRPSDEPRVHSLYWQGVMEVAAEKGEAEALRVALEKLREAYGDNVAHLKRYQERLEELSK